MNKLKVEGSMSKRPDTNNMKNTRRNRLAISVAASILLSGACTNLLADNDKFDINIKSQLTETALLELAENASVQIVFPDGLGVQTKSPAIRGQFTISQALDTMLKGSGLVYEFVSDDMVLIKQEESEGRARSTSTQEKEILEELIVTAQKREQSVKDVPISIVAMGAEEIEKRGITNLEDLSFAVPGLQVLDTGSWSRTIFLRGVGNGSGDLPLIGIYLDESAVTTGLKFSQIDLRTFDIDRVEVLRGPQGTLYGQGSMGGTIRYITNNPEFDNFSLKTNVSASFTQDGSPGQKIEGAVNIPVVEDELAFRVAALFENYGGWIDQPAAAAEDVNDQNISSIKIKGRWAPSEQLQVDAMLLSHRNDAGLPNQEDSNGNFTQAFNLTTLASTQSDYDIYNLTFNYDFDSFSLLSSSNYIDVLSDADQRGYIDISGYHYLALKWRVASQTFNQEIRLGSNGSGPWQWTVGAYYQDADLDYTQQYLYDIPAPAGGPLPPVIPFQSIYVSESWSVFANTSYALTDQLEVGAGLRYFEDEQGDGTQVGNFDSVDPRLYVNYDFNEDVKAYASIAKGFRSGGFNFDFLGQPPFEPESIWTYELGSKMSVFDGRLDAEVALFYSDYKDYVTFGINQATQIAYYFNAGNAEIKGVDWDFAWRATDDLQLIFNGSYIDAKISEVDPSALFIAPGDRIDNIPEFQYGLSAICDFMTGDKPGFVRVDYSHRGETTSPLSIGPSGVIKLLNIKFGWQWNENLSFGLFAKNLLNEREYFAPPTTLIGAEARTRPRTIGIEIGAEFN